MLEIFIDYSPREFYKGRREILIAFEENIFPLPNPYVFGENVWKEKYFGDEKFMPKTFKLNFLQEYNQTPLSEKENKILNRNFGYENDELAFAFNNTKTDEERDELFDKIVNKLSALKKLVKIVSSETEKKRINNVIKSVEFTLDQVASLGDSEPDFSDSDFSDTKESGLKILTPNQMLNRLPITLAQLKAGNNSEKLKNEIRQLLYSLYRSKKLTKKLYKSLIDII